MPFQFGGIEALLCTVFLAAAVVVVLVVRSWVGAKLRAAEIQGRLEERRRLEDEDRD